MGRQNTFYNMIKLIQSQLQRLATTSSSTTPTTVTDNYTEDISIEENNSCCTGIPLSQSFEPQQVRKKSLFTPPNDELTKHSPITLSSDIYSNNQLQQHHHHTNTPTTANTLSFNDANSKYDISNSLPTEQEQPQQQHNPRVTRTEEVAMLLSGGVDSSVALKLLLEQGYTVRAYYLKIWLEDEVAHLNACPWEEDLHYATAGTSTVLFMCFYGNTSKYYYIGIYMSRYIYHILSYYSLSTTTATTGTIPSLSAAGCATGDNLPTESVLARCGAVHSI